MGKHPLAFAVEKPIAAAQAASSSANVVPFNNLGRRRAKFEPVTSTWTSKNGKPPPSAATEGSLSGPRGTKGVIIDFPHADQGGHAATNGNDTGLTAADYAAIAYVVISAAFYPALAFLFWS